MTHVVLLNGPRQVGKDYIADKFIDLHISARKMPIMWPFKLAAVAEYGLPPSVVPHLDHTKDEPHAVLGGKTPRQVYIEYGELVRSEEGENAIADVWRKHVHFYKGYGCIVVPDVRFQPEVEAAKAEFGAHNVLLARVRRRDFDWRGDIGSYVTHWNVCEIDNTLQSENVGIELRGYYEEAML
jgi:hypothetical protein